MKYAKFLSLLVLILNIMACTTTSIQHTANEINMECGFEMQAARTAIRLRDKGKPKSDLEAQLVPIDKNSSRLLIKMHDIADEVYIYTQLNETVYSTFRYELCQRELLNKPTPKDIAAVIPELMACQAKFQDKSTTKSTNCIINAVETASLEQSQQEHGAIKQ